MAYLGRFVVASALLFGGCVGVIGDSGSGSEQGICNPAPPRVGLQRLTHDEYNRTVRDLFGVTTAPADMFPPDSSTAGFDNNAQSLTTSPLLAKLYLDAAEAVAREAFVQRRDEIMICTTNDAACAREILTALALRVYRRPVQSQELNDLMAMVDFAAKEGDSFEEGIEYAIAAMLMAPQFLYRSVPMETPTGAAGDVVVLDDYALASRLAYFLWGSTPDDALLKRAGAGLDDATLRAEMVRMLADPKASGLYDGFVKQWLQLGRIEDATPDATLFPEFDDILRQQMMEEARLFFDDLVAQDRSALEIIAATQTYANQELASIYGVNGVTGSALVSIDTDPLERAGVLTMPVILTMTSNPTTPNIVRRGVWLAEAILCAAPPPPEDGVPVAPEPLPNETERERLLRHRADPACATCHNLIDPLGFSFENYDAIGRWRDTADGVAVDNVGELPDGRSFAGVIELAQLVSDSGEYPTCITKKLMTYGLGRTMSASESCALSAIGVEHVTPDAKLSDLLWAIVKSDAFQTEMIPQGVQ